MRHFIAIGLLVLGGIVSIDSVWSASTTASSSGSWGSSGSWSNGVPGCGDTVYIPSGITITITSNVDLEACGSLNYIEVAGTLAFQTGRKLYLPCGSTVYLASGGSLTKGSGGGNSNLIEECGSPIWNAGDGNVSGPQYIGSGLPIVLKDFTGKVVSDRVRLDWTTLSEVNNDFFSIERSADLKETQILTTISGAGDSKDEISYEHLDLSPISGVNYYRLKQTDFDGRYSYSDWIAVDFNGSIQKIRIDWQQGRGELFVFLNDLKDQMVTIAVSDANGRIIHENTLVVPQSSYVFSMNTERLDVSNMTICNVRSNALSVSEKIISAR